VKLDELERDRKTPRDGEYSKMPSGTFVPKALSSAAGNGRDIKNGTREVKEKKGNLSQMEFGGNCKNKKK
jgi:hypothetical protein